MSEAGCEVSTAGNAEEAPARLVDLSPDLGLCVPSLPSDPLTRDQPEWGRRVDRHPLGIAIRRSRSGASRVLALKTKRNLRFSVPEEEGGTGSIADSLTTSHSCSWWLTGLDRAVSSHRSNRRGIQLGVTPLGDFMRSWDRPDHPKECRP